MTSFSFTVQ